MNRIRIDIYRAHEAAAVYVFGIALPLADFGLLLDQEASGLTNLVVIKLDA